MITGQVRRGDCVYVNKVHGIGHEIQKDRPAVVLSHPVACRNSEIVQVAFITKAVKKDTPYHVKLWSGQTVLCEQIYTVDISRLDWCDHIVISASEMRAIDDAIREQLYLGDRRGL